jgi:WD40 repeat protein
MSDQTENQLTAEAQLQSAKLRRQQIIFLCVALVLTAIAAFLGVQTRKNATTAQQYAATTKDAEKIATSRELAAAAVANLTIDPQRSILLALQGLSVQHTSEAENALRQSLATSRVKLTLTGKAVTTSTAFSPDGKFVAAAQENGLVQIWDIQTGQEVLTIDANAYISRVEYTSNGGQLITTDDRGYIHTWNAITGKLASSILAHQNGIWNMALSPDGTRLATTSASIIKVWDIASGEMLFILSNSTANISSIAFSRDGSRLATAQDEGNINIWDAATGEKLINFYNPDGCYPSIVFNKDATRLITSDGCGIIRFWDIAENKGQELFHRKTLTSGVLILSPDGNQLAINQNNSIAIWDASTGFDLFAIPNDSWSNDIDFSPDGKLLAAPGAGTSINILDLNQVGEKQVFIAQDGERVGGAVFSPDGTQLLTESKFTGDARIWDAATSQNLLSVKIPDICCSVAFSPDGMQFVAGSTSGNVNVLDAGTGKVAAILSASAWQISQTVFSPDGSRVATAGSDGIARIWDIQNGKQLFILVARSAGMVNDIAFSPDGKFLATASAVNFVYQGEVILWDAATGKQLFHLGFDPNAPATLSLAFSPDGKSLAAGYYDNTIGVWDLSPMKGQTQPTLILRGHSNQVNQVAYNPDGTVLASASDDGTIKLWNMSPGNGQGWETATLAGHAAEVYGISFSPDGKYLASAGTDGTVRVYYTQIEDLIAVAKERVTRSLTTEECQKYLHVDLCPSPP